VVRDQRVRSAAGRVGCSARRAIWRGAFGRETVGLRVDDTARPSSLYHPRTAERPRFRRGGYRGFARISGDKLCGVGARCLELLPLSSCWRCKALLGRSALGGSRLSLDSARASVIAHVVDSRIVHRYVFGIHIGDVGGADVVDCPIVKEGSVTPIPARIAFANVAETIVDAAIEAHGGPPVALIPDVRFIRPSPVTRSPEVTGHRREHPGAGHPVVAVCRVPRPITRSPNVTGSRADGLCINGEGWWTDTN
jgi:hypothetical protein